MFFLSRSCELFDMSPRQLPAHPIYKMHTCILCCLWNVDRIGLFCFSGAAHSSRRHIFRKTIENFLQLIVTERQLAQLWPFALPGAQATNISSPVSYVLRYPFQLFPCLSSPLYVHFKLPSPGVPLSPSLQLTLGVPVQGLAARATRWFAQRMAKPSPSPSSDVFFHWSLLRPCAQVLITDGFWLVDSWDST